MGEKTERKIMHCELCSHECDEPLLEVLEIYNDYWGEVNRFWACPDCVSEYEKKERKDQDIP